MLTTTLLKVRFAGRERAAALEPYINACDIYSLELGLLTETQAVGIEEEWNAMLRQELTPQAFKGWYSSRLWRPSQDPESIAYKDHEIALVARHRKPLYFIGRHARPSQIEDIAREAQRGMQLQSDGAIAYLLGKKRQGLLHTYGQGLLHTYDGIKRYNLALQRAHRTMAADISEANVRRRHPTIRSDPLRLTACVGALHAPEKYATAPLEIVHLYDTDWKRREVVVADRIVNGASFEDMIPALEELITTEA
jgi:hypothetical protein